MKKTITIHSIDAMDRLAQTIGQFLIPGSVIALEGDLGAGKTTFTQFLGRALGIDDTINSPTFTLMKIYDNTLPLYHIDAYRLEGIDTLDDEAFIEYIDGDGVCVIEWYKNIEHIMPRDFLSLHIEYIDETSRQITLEGTDHYEQIIENIAD